MSRVLVAGCGDLGVRVARRLLARGHEVAGLRRDPSRLPPPIVPVRADLSDPATLAGLPERIDLVVYAAAADRRDEATYARAYVDGPRHLVAALARRPAAPARLLFVSSTSVWGQDDGRGIDERTRPEPGRFTGRAVLAGERAVAEAPWPARVLRLAGLYGPGRTRLLERLRAGTARRTGPPSPWTNRIHVEDAAQAAVHLLCEEDAPALAIGADDRPATRDEVYETLAAELGLPVPPLEPPDGPRALGKRCSNARLRASGWTPARPTFVEGYRELIAGGA